MARAKRHYLQGYVWHLRHRCHKKEFLLILVKDRQRCLYWLFQAKKRYAWTQSIAVGDKSFVEQIKDRLGIRSKGRKLLEEEDGYPLRERQTGYYDRAQFNSSNSFYWNLDHKPADPPIP